MKVSIQLYMLFITVLVLGGAHLLALEFFLYWKHPWFDIPMHVLGGIMASFFLLFTPAFGAQLPNRYYRLVPTIIFVLIIGLAWEVFEIWGGVLLNEPGFIADTLLDLCMDVLGGIVGYVVATNINKL